MSGGNKSQGQQISSTKPWDKAAPYLKKYMGEADQLYDQGAGFNPYQGNWWTDMSNKTEKALGGMWDTAKQGNPLNDQSMNVAGRMIHGDFNPSASGYQDLLGKSGNEAFQSVIDQQAGALGDDITRQFGGSSFGNAAHSGAIADQVGDFRNRMASDNWNQNIANQRGLLGDITNVGQMGVQNRLAGVDRAGTLYDQQFAPYDRMAQVGSMYDDQNARKLQGKMAKWDANQNADWSRLGAASPFAGGYGGFGGTTSTQVQSPSNPWGSALGGGLLGAQMGFPGIGALAGLLGGM